ncbi:MAG: hypothetical protein KGJ86_13765 [Chloroflexota bacterium]|nr:hypothetical protein [Chloroflexota bacterium]
MAEVRQPDGPHAKMVSELTVDLTIAWLKRVEGTADGRDPKEVIQAMDEFFRAIQRYRQEETRTSSASSPAAASTQPAQPVGI